MLVEQAQTAGARLTEACEVLGLDSRTVQRWRTHPAGQDMRMGPKTTPANKLSEAERAKLLHIANSPQYRDLPAKQIVPRLADSGVYIASESTFERVLKAENMNTHRGPKRSRSPKKPREKSATKPGQLWSWDITYLRSPIAGKFFYLYMVVDIWSRKIVGHVVHEHENTELASRFIRDAHEREGSPVDLILHQDNGSPMKGSTLKATLDCLGVTRSYSRPHVSDDNPVSESLFGTMKTRPDYPSEPFAKIEDARVWVDKFVAWYNGSHRHSSIAYVTPNQRHAGIADEILKQRRLVYAAAKRRHSNRWSRNTRQWQAPTVMYLNPDKKTMEAA